MKQPVAVATDNGEESSVKLIGAACNFHKPGSDHVIWQEITWCKIHLWLGMNHLTDNYIVTPKTMQLLQKHLEETGGQVEWLV